MVTKAFKNLTRYKSENNFVRLITLKILCRTLKLIARMSKFFVALKISRSLF